MFSPISARVLILVCFLLSASLASAAQAPTPTPPIAEDDVVVKVESRLVVVPVSVVDANGDPVLGLTAKSFRILEENRPQVIDNIGNAENVPLEIALLFDVSASTDAMFTFQQETAAKFLREVLRPEDRATIFTIGQTPILVQGRESVEKAIEAVMRIRPTKGATAFYDTVRAAADYLKVNSPSGRRRVILVISDGEDNFSDGVQRAQRAAERRIADNRPDPELKRLGKLIVQAQQSAKNSERVRVLRSLQDADIVHYSINPGGSSYLLNQISVFGQENMQIFSDDTGGTAFLPRFAPIDTKDYLQNAGNSRRNTETLERIFRQLANELRAQYLLQYYSESNFPDGRFVKLSVGLNGRTDLRVRARQGYYVRRPE
jgi:Ca-activated chloride channel family protein